MDEDIQFEDSVSSDTDYDELERDWDEPYEPDSDGQPDKAQEWHDFDPDC